MNSKILSFVNKCESWKVEIKELHWAAKNLSQHKLCDDIASAISDFEDLVSEVEQSISGKIELNTLNPDKASETNLKDFVEDVISSSKDFLKELEGMGEQYIGIKSECESFIGTMQRNLYLVNFTMKEELKARLKAKINESMPKSLNRHDEVDKFMGRKPKSIKARINQIYRIVKKYGIDSRKYNDDHWQAIEDYYRAISSLGCKVQMKPCGSLNNADSMESDGGYCDYDPSDNMPRSKQYSIKILFEDGMMVDGYIKCMAAGTVSDPFSAYDTCIVLWPKNNRVLESINEYGDNVETREKMGMAAKRGIMKGDDKPYQNAMDSLHKRGSSKEELGDLQRGFEMENKEMKLTESELKQLVKEAAIKILSETPLNYDVDNFSGRWTKTEPSDEEMALADVQDDYLDNPFKKSEIEQDLADDEWEWGKDMTQKDVENDYSWDRFDKKPIAQGLDNYYKVGKGRIPDEVDDAIAMRNKNNSWSDRELNNRHRMMGKWLDGERTPEQIGDAWDDLHFEGKEPMKITESELKEIVKEAASKIISEIGDTLSGAYKIGKLAARQGHRDREPMKSAQTLAHGLKSAPKDDKEYDRWTNAAKEGYSDGKKEFNPSESVEEGDSGIHIKPSKEGTFTAAATKHGESVQGFASKVLKNKDNYSPAMVKKANFARNAKKFKH